jgi:hypothetical protein
VAWTNDVQKAVLVEGAKAFRAQNPARGTAISYWLKSAAAGDVKITISDITGREIRSIDGTKQAGLNRVQWNLAPNGGGRGGRGFAGGGGGRGAQPPPVGPGSYLVKVTVGDKLIGQKTVVVEPDSGFPGF